MTQDISGAPVSNRFDYSVQTTQCVKILRYLGVLTVFTQTTKQTT